MAIIGWGGSKESKESKESKKKNVEILLGPGVQVA